MSKEPIYTLTEESLKKLLDQSFKSGVIAGLSSLHNAMEEHIPADKFPNTDMANGFEFAKLMIAGALVKAQELKDKNKE